MTDRPRQISEGQTWRRGRMLRRVVKVWDWAELRSLLGSVGLSTPEELRNSRVQYLSLNTGRLHWCNLSTFYTWSRKADLVADIAKETS